VPSVLTIFSSDVGSIKGGIIQTLKNKVQAPYNILLVGETGTGKSSLLEFIANVLIGKDIDCYDFEILDHTNEQGGSSSQSEARVYELKSRNGIMVSFSGWPVS
jgi:ATPase subunit of ABC transporter with duplicated ATPase domains